jgi:hypothetical protein
MITYRKTKDGKWVACGPVAEVKIGEVTVTKASGERKTEQVVSLGHPFQTDNGTLVYGYLAARAPSLAPQTTSAPRSVSARTRRYICEECGDWVNPGTSCWETGLTH